MNALDFALRQRAWNEKYTPLQHFLRAVDILVFANLIYVYLLDPSLIRLVLRGFVQLNYLTPKPFVSPTPARAVFLFILGSNAFCLLVHMIWTSPPLAEESFGYIHGGLILDFIGQAPGSRLGLFLLDVSVCTLQIVILMTTHSSSAEDSSGTAEVGESNDAHSGQVLASNVRLYPAIASIWASGFVYNVQQEATT